MIGRQDYLKRPMNHGCLHYKDKFNILDNYYIDFTELKKC